MDAELKRLFISVVMCAGELVAKATTTAGLKRLEKRFILLMAKLEVG
jgi:hypothetical protein